MIELIIEGIVLGFVLFCIFGIAGIAFWGIFDYCFPSFDRWMMGTKQYEKESRLHQLTMRERHGKHYTPSYDWRE